MVKEAFLRSGGGVSRRAPNACVATVRAASLLLLSAAVMGGGGCQRGPVRPKTVPVEVTVSYQGKLVGGATVVFIPKDGPRTAVGRTDSKGRAKLTSFAAGDGAVPGSYTVTIDKVLDEAPRPGKTQEEYEAFLKANGPGGSRLPPLKCELPVRYSQAEKTDLQADVQEKGKNSFRFELVDSSDAK